MENHIPVSNIKYGHVQLKSVVILIYHINFRQYGFENNHVYAMNI